MKITHHIPAAFLVGSLISVASPAQAGEAGVGSVELIPFPEGVSEWVNAYFSGDGQLRLAHTYTEHDSDIYRYADGEWELIRRELRTIVPGITPFGTSDDGTRLVLSDFTRVDIVDDQAVVTLPREWRFTDQDGRERRAYGWVSAGTISGDGRVVTASGRENGQGDLDSLVWDGGGQLINISDSLPREDHSYGPGLPNRDGSVIAFKADTPAEDIIWVWDQGELIEIPRLDPDSDEHRSLRSISESGHRVFGNENGPDRGGFDSTLPLVGVEDWIHPVSNASIAWMWTRATGTVELIDRTRFDQMIIRDIDAEGTMALVTARVIGDREADTYLWLGGNTFVELRELFHTLNISIDADSYSFNEISDDGTKLMGLANVNGEANSHAIIVTIPDLTP